MKVHFWAVFDWASKVILVYLGFLVLTLLCGWLVKLALLSHPMRSKANSDFHTRIFLRLLPATCNCFKFWLAHCFLYIDYDGLSICFGFGFTMLGWSNNFLKNSSYLFVVSRIVESNPMNLFSRVSRRTWRAPISGTSIMARGIFGTRIGKFALKWNKRC